MLAPANEAYFGEEPLVRLLVAGAARWPGFAAALECSVGSSIGFEPSGTVVVAADPSDRAALDQLLAFRSSIGLASERLSATECRKRIAALSPSICGGAEVPGDRQVDNRRLVTALHQACVAAGVHFVSDRVSAVAVVDGTARAWRTERGERLAAAQLVAAMGWRTALLGGLPEGTLPEVRPVKGHVLRLAGEGPLIDRTVRGLVKGRTCYLVPRHDHSLVVGATVEEMGDDVRVQAGAVFTLLDDARSLVPGVDELELVECSVGLRPGTPDNAPRVGWTKVPGLAVATGHYRNGILLAQITAEAVMSLLGGADVPPELEPFGLVAGAHR